MENPNRKIAVVLLNLGGPDSPAAVKPFLFNLFSDPAILSVPNPIRYLLASFLSKRRESEAQEIYEKIGGRSPLLPLTQKQALALQHRLTSSTPQECKVFVCMRYWHPMTEAVVAEVKAWEPDEILLVPLYPQFSTTTTASSFKEWTAEARRAELSVPTKKLCCYPDQEGFIAAHAQLVQQHYDMALATGETPRVLFTAHGLPESVVEKGDPYQWQVERTSQAIVEKLSIAGLDWGVCYQSRVGPLEWIKPYTDHEIASAARRKKPLVVVPMAFVSDHSETLVELDIQYKQLAADQGLDPSLYFRVPALNEHPLYIEALAAMCKKMLARQTYLESCHEKRICPAQFTGCAYHHNA